MADVQQQLQAQPVPPHELAGWDAWPDVDQQQENEWQEEVDQVMEEPVQQQDSVSFDQSGSTAEYLRAHGPDIVLNVEDVLSGKFKTGSSSSTSSDASSSVHPEVHNMIHPTLLAVEIAAFQKLLIPNIPPVLNFPVFVNTALIQTITSGSSVQHNQDDSLAIVPVKPPSLHSVLLHLWAFWHSENQTQPSSSSIDVEVEVTTANSPQPLLDATLQPGAPSVPQDTRRTLSLPRTVSKRSSRKPLVTQGCRRSSRLNISEGFKHSQLPDKTPRKKRKVLDSAALHLLDNPPRPSDIVPAPVPIETLQQWGLFCNVSPSELTADELMTRKTNDGQDAVP
jgi:hypothetical protein